MRALRALLGRLRRHPQPFRGSAVEPIVGWIPEMRDLPCAECGLPSVGWAFEVMGDDEAIDGRSVCAAHLAGVAA